MIPSSAEIRQVPAWQTALAHAVRDPQELLALLDLDPGWLPAARAAARLFPLRVPRGYVRRMAKGDPCDPLLRQVLPLKEEMRPAPGYGTDPVGDLAAMRAPGVLQKYQGRALLTVTGACAVHCRYCFRRHFPYGAANPSSDDWHAALAYIASDAGIREVILSGGDPLTLPDHRLAGLSIRLQRIPHVQRLRIHTRLPVVLPERVDMNLLGWLAGLPVTPVMVIHANHPNEIDAPVRGALTALKSAGVTLLNQAVLLRGVNDDAGVLAGLSEILFTCGVLPYYLHQLDRVQGAAHFEVDDAVARRLHADMAARLPGYLVPRLVREEAGAAGKTPLILASPAACGGDQANGGFSRGRGGSSPP